MDEENEKEEQKMKPAIHALIAVVAIAISSAGVQAQDDAKPTDGNFKSGTLFQIVPGKSSYRSDEQIVLTLTVQKNTPGNDPLVQSIEKVSYTIIDDDPDIPGGGVVGGWRV